jgi:hypothetical protein
MHKTPENKPEFYDEICSSIWQKELKDLLQIFTNL